MPRAFTDRQDTFQNRLAALTLSSLLFSSGLSLANPWHERRLKKAIVSSHVPLSQE